MLIAVQAHPRKTRSQLATIHPGWNRPRRDWQSDARERVMNFDASNANRGANAAVGVDEKKPHLPRWPAFVLAFSAVTTLLWISALLWLLSRILIFVFYD